MPTSPALVIRNGTIVDGSGNDPFEADIAVADGRITAIGGTIPPGAEEIDAKGKLVTPGFVDVHTHYDAQVTWGSRLTPSSWNGVTTVLLGNCGVGFAPCHPDQRDMLVKLMEGVEDIPEVVLTEGLPWTWQSFPDFMNTLAANQYDVDVAAQVPHAALRVFVMGQRGADREPATEQDRRRMAELTMEGMQAGALGFSTSRTLNHRTLDGRPTPTLRAEEAELTAIAHALRDSGRGWLQIVSDFEEQDDEFGLFQRLAAAAGRPVTITLLQSDARPDGWRGLLDRIAALNADKAVDGILVQLPLPPHIRSAVVIEAIDPAKDVDGFHPLNSGRLADGRPALAPATPSGIMKLLAAAETPLRGARAVVVGRSAIVGRPAASLLLAADATVTIAHSRTRNLPDVCRAAEVLVVAIGRPDFVRGDWVAPGATVIDVGVNRLPDGKLTGDVAFAECTARAGAITPVPGGVGPMTIACLLENTVTAAIARR